MASRTESATGVPQRQWPEKGPVNGASCGHGAALTWMWRHDPGPRRPPRKKIPIERRIFVAAALNPLEPTIPRKGARALRRGPMKHIFISMAAVSALTVSSFAFAGGGKGKWHGAWMKKLDANGDGQVTLAEARSAGEAHFKELDTNKDGALTLEEVKSGHQKMARAHGEERFAAKDANKDGRLSKAEAQMPDKWFSKLDTNNDGFVTKEEWNAAKARKGEKRGQFADKMFQKMDANGDGKVTRAEARAAGDAMFRRVDADGNGVITKEEMQAARGHKGKHHGKKKGGQGRTHGS